MLPLAVSALLAACSDEAPAAGSGPADAAAVADTSLDLGDDLGAVDATASAPDGSDDARDSTAAEDVGGVDGDLGVDGDTEAPDGLDMVADAADPGSSEAGDAEPDALTVAECFADAFVRPSPIVLDYDQFGPIVGSHCLGTNHQDIVGVERVVFLGDSVTVGTPPTQSDDFYRVELAERLANRFDLDPPGPLWRWVDLVNGTTVVRESGDFASCARWGARTDDLQRDDSQIADCFPDDLRHLHTLVIMTIGGNDVAAITQAGLDGEPLEEIWADDREFVALLRDAVVWLKTPGRFPNGVDVVFANMFEFTDGTGDTSACPAAALAGFGAEWENPDDLAELVVWANEQYLSIAVDTGSDMIFMLEHFCGHGFNHDNPDTPCYRGPDAGNWFDLTCIHPNPLGHGEIARMFMAVVEE